MARIIKVTPHRTLQASALCFLLTLAGCSSIGSDSCADIANMSKADREANRCDGGFFSAGNLRGTTYQGDDGARLWTGAPARTERDIDPATVNANGSTRAPVVGYVGSLRVEVSSDHNALAKDLADLRLSGAPSFNPDETVAVSFENATIDYFLKQLLGGALGVNYIAPPNLGGSITFRAEKPIAKGQLVQVVRDVLGRNGLEMAFMNGVYQIGNQQEMESLRAASQAGRETDFLTRVVRLRKGHANDIIGFVQQLVPGSVRLTPTGDGSAIIVRASSSDMGKITELITVSDSGIGDDRVAIIPLHESSPESITAKLNEFYRSQMGENSGITLMPLENQQAILVGAKDARVMQGLKSLVAKLDRDTGSDVSLRIIPLTHLGADEIVPQLNEIFSGNGGSEAPSGRSAANGRDNGNGNGNSNRRSYGEGALAEARAAIKDVDSQSSSAASDDTSSPPLYEDNKRAGGSDGGASRVGGGSTQSIKIVADQRNNTVMVYASYVVFKRIKRLLETLDVPQAQVVIEATVAEVTLNDQLKRGVEAFLTSSNILDVNPSPQIEVGSSSQGGSASGKFRVAGASVEVILTALQAVTTVKVVSSPYLTVRDGKPARLVIGDQVPFTRSTQTANPDTGAVVTVAQVETKDTGVILQVTPRIRQDNSTILTINQSVSTVVSQQSETNLTPTINTREISSEVIAKSGSTIMLGGLIKESVNKTETGVPVLKDIAVLGELFKQTEDVGRREEMIIMITPRVIRHSAQIENITRQIRGAMHIR